MTDVVPARPALRYFGGKWRLAPWIISHFPEHQVYVEPYGGSAAVLLRKTPCVTETFNDLDRSVVAFFKVLRERPADLIRAIDLTPFSRAEYELAREPCDDELEAARRLYVLSYQQRGGARHGRRGGWRFGKLNHNAKGSRAIVQWQDVGHLWAVALRLKLVQIECDDALAVIRRYDTDRTLFYLDPPYVQSARNERWRFHAYHHELSDDQHRELAAVLHAIKGMAIVSGYPSPLYEEIYRGWETRTCRAVTDASQNVTECLWLNPAAAARAKQLRLPTEEVPADG